MTWNIMQLAVFIIRPHCPFPCFWSQFEIFVWAKFQIENCKNCPSFWHMASFQVIYISHCVQHMFIYSSKVYNGKFLHVLYAAKDFFCITLLLSNGCCDKTKLKCKRELSCSYECVRLKSCCTQVDLVCICCIAR